MKKTTGPGKQLSSQQHDREKPTKGEGGTTPSAGGKATEQGEEAEEFLVEEARAFAREIQGGRRGKAHAFEQIDKLYKTNIKTIDHNLGGMYEFLKPQAPSIYFERKVELGNIVNDKKRADERKREAAKDRKDTTGEKKESAFEKNTAELRKLMNQFDIKHPLRGEEFEDLGTISQPFHHKIQKIVAGPNSYMGYKKDLRQTLDFSAIRSESYLKEEQAKFQRQRIIMKYRLYGRDGVTEREYNKLIEWRVVKLKPGEEGRRAVRVKRRIKKQKRAGPDSAAVWYSSEDSRSCDSAYTTKLRFAYADNEDGDPTFVNNGFQIQPLDPALYGSRAARESRARKAKQKRGMTLNVSSRNQIGGATQQNPRGLGKPAGGTVRSPLKIPELRLKGAPTPTSKDVSVDPQAYEAIREHQRASRKHQGSKTQTLQFPHQSKGSLASQMAGAFDLEARSTRRGASQLASNLPQSRQRILMPHLVNKYAVERASSYAGGQAIDEGSEEGRFSPQVGRPLQDAAALGFSFGGESVDQLEENGTNMTGSSRQSIALAGLAGRTGGGMKGRAEFIIDKRSGARFKYQNNEDIHPEILRSSGEEPLGQSVRIKQRGLAGAQGGSVLSQYGASGAAVANALGSHDGLYQSARGHSMLAPGSTRRGPAMKHPQNMSQLSEYTVKVRPDAREAGSPYRFKAIKDVSLKANLERKTLGQGRLNKLFTERTPKLADGDIRSLISKYPVEDVAPVKPEEEEKLKEEEEARKQRNILAQMSQTQLFKSIYGSEALEGREGGKPASKYEIQVESNRQRKRELEFLGKNIDKMERQSKAHYKDLLTKLVIQNFRDEELGKITEAVRELEFAGAEAIPNLYKHRARDEAEKQQVVLDVTREHQEGKLDPTKFMTRSKHKRK